MQSLNQAARIVLMLMFVVHLPGCTKSDYQIGLEEGNTAAISYAIAIPAVSGDIMLEILTQGEPEHFPGKSEEYNRGYKEGWRSYVARFVSGYNENSERPVPLWK